MKKFRYEFECGHAANADNEFALGAVVMIVDPRQSPAKTRSRFCPRCTSRMLAAYDRCIKSGERRARSLKLPESPE